MLDRTGMVVAGSSVFLYGGHFTHMYDFSAVVFVLQGQLSGFDIVGTWRSAHLVVCWKPPRIQPSFRKIKKMYETYVPTRYAESF